MVFYPSLYENKIIQWNNILHASETIIQYRIIDW